MININPLMKQLAERGLTLTELSQLSGIPKDQLGKMQKGLFINQERINTLCKILNCQPCDVIEFTKNETKGHWEWINQAE